MQSSETISSVHTYSNKPASFKLTLGSKGLRHLLDLCPLSQCGTSRKKIVCTEKIYEIGCRKASFWISSISFISLTNGQGNPGKVGKLILWSMKPWKSQGILSIYVGSQGIIGLSHTLGSTTHIMFILCCHESKRQHKIVPTGFFHTLSLVSEGLRITCL